MSDQGSWFKLWLSADDDPDLGNLSLADFGRWCKFGMYLKKHGTKGEIELKAPCLPLQRKLELDSFEAVLAVLNTFPNCLVWSRDNVTDHVTNGVTDVCAESIFEKQKSNVTGVTNAIVTWKNWERFQGDNSRDRVRQLRARVTAKKRREEKRTEENREDENKDNKHRNRKSVAPLVPWPPEDLWLKTLIAQQPFFSHAVEPLSDFGWWEDVSTAINGIDPRFIEPEFAKMSAWLRENPGRKPTAKGMRRFVRTWLERARENQRRLYAVKK